MSLFFRGYEDLKAIRISELIQQHYTEDRTAGMQFEKKIWRRKLPFVIGAIASMVVAFVYALTELLTNLSETSEFVATIYVCPDSKTFFPVTWLAPGSN